MTENLIKRYLLEKAYLEGKEEEILTIGEDVYQKIVFELLNQGKIKLNEEEFKLWLKELKTRNMMFGLYLNSLGYIKGQERIIEINEAKNLSCISSISFNGKKEKIIERFGDFYSSKPKQNNLKGHLIINGIYANQLIYLARSSLNGTFTVGYCGDIKSFYTKRVINYYKRLKKVLNEMTNGNCETVEETIKNENKIYVLTNNKPSIWGNNKVVTKCSER